MLSRSPEEEAEDFFEPLRQAAGCVTSWPLIALGYRPSPVPHTIAFAPLGATVSLDVAGGGKRGIELLVFVPYHIVQEDASRRGWRAVPVSYFYHVLDHETHEILGYHWHPEAVGPSFPHLHVSGRLPALALGPGFAPVALGDMHLPTAHITFAGVARLLIEEFEIAPQRADWESVLAVSDEREQANVLR